MITKNGLITLTQVSDGPQGPSGEQYILETSQQEIIKLVNSATSEKAINSITFDPNIIQIRLLKKEEGGYSSQNLSIENFSLYLYFNNEKILINQNYINPDANAEVAFLVDEQEEAKDVSNALYLDEEDQNKCYLNLRALCYNLSQFQGQGENVNNLLGALIEDCLLNIVYIDSAVSASTQLPIRYGTTWDMASFAVEATKLLGKVQDKTLQFDRNGLNLVNGGLALYKDSIEEENKVFYVDTDTRTLVLKGAIYADEGRFGGQLDAPLGTIGGFNLSGGELTSADENQSLVISGQTGLIKAQNIELGSNAKIQDHIILGNAVIQNPNYSSPKRAFIEAGDYITISKTESRKTLQIFDNGLANFGNITIDGPHSVIKGEINGSTSFSITPEYANFPNINCSGAIKTVVFKKNAVQAAGGAMIFRPSYKIESIEELDSEEGSIITLTEKFEGGEGTTVWIAKNFTNTEGKFGNACQEAVVKKLQNENQIQVSSTGLIDYEILFDMGIKGEYIITNDLTPKEGKKYYILSDQGYKEVENIPSGSDMSNYYEKLTTLKNFIMGINAGDTEIGANSEELLLGRGLTIREYGRSTPNLFLGDLQSVNKQGYGLYCDNVYLTGSLTTKSSSGLTAGVNTASGINGDKDVVGIESPIIFWAGARGESETAIQNAPFQVTESGHVYAKQMRLVDSVFVDGTITGARIDTAEIHGTGDGPALSIYDTIKGITFYNESNETFSISSDGFKIDGKNFIKINKNLNQFFGEFIGNLKTTTNDGDIAGEIVEENGVLIKYNSVERVKIDADNIKMFGTIKYGNMEYREAKGGYDLYVV